MKSYLCIEKVFSHGNFPLRSDALGTAVRVDVEKKETQSLQHIFESYGIEKLSQALRNFGISQVH